MCDNQLINGSLYGGVPGHTTGDPLFIREMEYELCRLIRYPVIHFDNDAQSCYDRIPCFLANVTSRKNGMHKRVVIVQGKTLKEAKYILKTKFGLSEEQVSHTVACPWFGTGQGSGNSPLYWLEISSDLFDIYQAKAIGGATYQSPDGTMILVIFQLGYVDDVMNRTNVPLEVQDPSEALQDLIDRASAEPTVARSLRIR